MSANTETTIAQPLPEQPAKIESTWTSFVPMILIFAVFYFLLIRPQEKKRKQQESLVSSVKKGEDIVTTGGIHGRVVSVNESDSTIILEIADNISIKLAKAAIFEITSRKLEDKENKIVKNESTDSKSEVEKPTTKELIKKKPAKK